MFLHFRCCSTLGRLCCAQHAAGMATECASTSSASALRMQAQHQCSAQATCMSMASVGIIANAVEQRGAAVKLASYEKGMRRSRSVQCKGKLLKSKICV